MVEPIPDSAFSGQNVNAEAAPAPVKYLRVPVLDAKNNLVGVQTVTEDNLKGQYALPEGFDLKTDGSYRWIEDADRENGGYFHPVTHIKNDPMRAQIPDPLVMLDIVESMIAAKLRVGEHALAWYNWYRGSDARKIHEKRAQSAVKGFNA